jgi:uncharacterized glyoxalase superfamily protein PhnB
VGVCPAFGIAPDNLKKDIPALEDRPQSASVLFYFYIEDIDEVYKNLKTHTEIAKELETTWYGMREFYVRDCNGYVLGFGEKEQS